MSDKPVLDPFAAFRAFTRARVGLGRAGDALPTSALLDFQAAHARARDAVHAAVDFDRLGGELLPQKTLRVRSRAAHRAEYLRRPDLGRRLDARDAEQLLTHQGAYDFCLVIADGLSASAVQARAVPLARELERVLGDIAWAPIVLAEQARVALGDEIGQLLGARFVAVAIGERPGLSISDSIGLYLTSRPVVGRTDAERNCISNVHADGLGPEEAAALVGQILRDAERLGSTGVGLKLSFGTHGQFALVDG